ncbi:MAG TPA: IS110 family transposase [Streptosporangiaceae bacterium]
MATVARRHQALAAEITHLDTALQTLLDHAAPAGFQTKTGVGTRVAATLLITAGDNPGRLHTEASFAALCGASPIDASSGKQRRHRLNRGGDRQANSALWRIVFTRIATDLRTQAYVARRTSEGKTTREIIRCLIGGLSVPRSGQPGRGSLVALGDGLVAEPVVTASFSTATPGAPRPP